MGMGKCHYFRAGSIYPNTCNGWAVLQIGGEMAEAILALNALTFWGTVKGFILLVGLAVVVASWRADIS